MRPGEFLNLPEVGGTKKGFQAAGDTWISKYD
jgi:hypothetical protein